MAIFNTLLLNCFLLPLFNPPVRYLNLPASTLFYSLPLLPSPNLPVARRQVHVHSCVHIYIRTIQPGLEVATGRAGPGAKHLSVSSCAGPPVLKIHLSSDTCTSRPPSQPTPSPHPATLSYYPFRHYPRAFVRYIGAFDLLDPYSRAHDATALGILQKDSYLPPVPPCLLLVIFFYLQSNSSPHPFEKEIVELNSVLLSHHPAILTNFTTQPTNQPNNKLSIRATHLSIL